MAAREPDARRHAKTAPPWDTASPKLEIVPGQSGRLERPRISLFGKHIATLPTRNFNLDPRVRGVGLPSLSIKRTGDYGITWEAVFEREPVHSVGDIAMAPTDAERRFLSLGGRGARGGQQV